ncbi:uncharacterized protein [Maniola hyperantus]|uniref:uncharacterized protein n=1 Tax=Aphantopus hyperantus TaxID=2795564 RepID=UPI002132A715
MKVLIILALAAVSAAVPANRDKRSYGLQYGNNPGYQSLQSNSEHSTSYQTSSRQSSSLQAYQPYQQYQQYQPAVEPIYTVQQPLVQSRQVYRPQVYAYPARQQPVYSPQVQSYYPAQTYTPVRTYAPVQTYAQTYTPVQTYASPVHYHQQSYGADPWC